MTGAHKVRQELAHLEKRCGRHDAKACKLVREYKKEKRAHPALPNHVVLRIAKDHLRYRR